ncbi:MAG TPA: IucA/IucC family C-terminal-domain containing protein [Acidimicrobiales bacterium]|nr:IucA/IucC family C-terminal-domain containing protein [Acidimicrobiales bacterium]
MLAETLGRVGDLLSYLKAVIGPVECAVPMTAPVEDGIWLACGDLIENADWLGRVFEGTGRAIGTDDQVVAASIFIQGYAYRLLALAVASFTVGGIVPGSAPTSMAIGLGRGRASKVAYCYPTVFELVNGRNLSVALLDQPTVDQALMLLLDEVVEGHLRPLIATTRRQLRVGDRLLWGNVAASASTAFRTMEGCLGPWVIPLGHRFFELGPSDLKGLGSFLLIEDDAKHGWFWERTNCCLFDRIPGHARCADCSLTPFPERRSAYARSLKG